MTESQRVGPSFAVTVKFEVLRQHSQEFLMLVKQNAVTSVAMEPECLRFDILQSSDNGVLVEIFLYELYVSRQSFDYHLSSSHFVNFDSATKHMVNSKAVRTYVAEVHSK